MPGINNFSLNFIREEPHLMLPTVASIKLTQNLYNTLFQYVLTPEKEKLLKNFIEMLESHIKRKDKAPFSKPITELDFLDDGLQELKLLNWVEVPVAIFEISLADVNDAQEQETVLEEVLTHLEGLMIFSRPAQNNIIWVYPYVLVR